jgi:hypothetical protein
VAGLGREGGREGGSVVPRFCSGRIVVVCWRRKKGENAWRGWRARLDWKFVEGKGKEVVEEGGVVWVLLKWEGL